MRLTRLIKSFQIGLNREKIMYGFINANNSGKAEINLIRKNLSPTIGNCDHDIICHVLQHYLKESSPYTMGQILHFYQLERKIDDYFTEDFLLLNKESRKEVIKAAEARNSVRKMDIDINKLKLTCLRHQKVLNECELQLKELEKLMEK
jgi:hypothetical protein